MRLFIILLGCLLASAAHAARTTLSIVINGPASTVVSCPLAATYTAPLSAGSVVCAIGISPSSWSGVLALSGTSAGSFALSGQQLVVGSTALPAGSYSVTITATP